MQTNLVKIKKKQRLEELTEDLVRTRKLNKVDRKALLKDKQLRVEFYNPKAEV